MNRTEAADLLADQLADWIGPYTGEQLGERLDLPAVLAEAFRDDPEHGLWLAVDTDTLRQIAIRHLLTGKPTPTDLPCPPWCERGHGHPLSSVDRGLFREHLRRFGAGRSLVELVSTEYAAGPAGPVVYDDDQPDPDGALILLAADPSQPLTSEHARALAANLTAAATTLDTSPRRAGRQKFSDG